MKQLVKRQLKKLEAIKTKYEMMRLDLVKEINENPGSVFNDNHRQEILKIDKEIQKLDASIRSCKQTINSLF